MSTLNRVLSLVAVITLAAALSLALSSGALAGTLFQSSPPPPAVQPTVGPAFPIPTAAPPTLPPAATATAPILQPTPTSSGFLPAPTLTNPNALPPPPQAGVITGPTAPLESEPTAPREQDSPMAAWIDVAIETLGYVWLCCGGILLVAAAVVFAWLSRRTTPG